MCDFLLQLNGYVQTAQIQYEKGGVDSAGNVEHFLINCGDEDVMDLIYRNVSTTFSEVRRCLVINCWVKNGSYKVIVSKLAVD